jgi:iron(III) transport system permease protein
MERGGQAATVGLALASVAAAVLLLVAVVLIAFQGTSASGTQTYTTGNFVALYREPFAYISFLNSIGFGLVAVVTALLLAIPMAWLVERTDLPGRDSIFALATLTLVVPGFFTAMGWSFLLHPRIGIVNKWLSEVFFIAGPLVNIATIPGMGWVEGLSLSPLAFIMIASSLRAMDPSLEESAQVHGMGLFDRLTKVTFPLLWPGILAAGIYIFAIALGAFDIPAIIGMRERIFTFSIFVWTQAQPEDVLPNYGVVAASSAFMIAISAPFTWWYLRVIGQSNRYAVVTGRNYRPKRIVLGRWWIAGWAYVGLFVLLTAMLPLLTLAWAAFTPYLQPISLGGLERLTLQNFYTIPWTGFWKATLNTGLLTLAVPTVTSLLALAISWVVVRSGLRLAPVMDTLAFLPHVIPNLVFAIGAIVVSLFWIGRYVPIYGTIMILMVTYVVTRLSFATRVYNGALIQLHRELDEAGYVFGLGTLGVLWNIVRPLLAPALLYSWIWMALITYRELTMATLLATGKNVTLPVFIWGIWSSDSLNQAAALSLLLICMLSPLVLLYFLLGRRSLAAV